MIASSLLCAHPFELSFSFCRLSVLALQLDDQRLLLCQAPFAFDDIALDLRQLIKYRSRVHHDSSRGRAANSRRRPALLLHGLKSPRRATGPDARLDSQLGQPLDVPAVAIFSRIGRSKKTKLNGKLLADSWQAHGLAVERMHLSAPSSWDMARRVGISALPCLDFAADVIVAMLQRELDRHPLSKSQHPMFSSAAPQQSRSERDQACLI